MKQNTMKKILCIITGILAIISLTNCLAIVFSQAATKIFYVALFEAVSFAIFFLISLPKNTK